MRAILLIAFALAGCGSHDPKDPKPDDRLPALRDSLQKAENEALGLRDAVGWLTPDDGDGMLWTGKYGAVAPGVDLTPAEVEPGRFDRNPGHPTSDDPEWSSWSRDMGMGLMAFGLRTKDLALLQRHAEYGRANNWVMGRPLGDGRSLYTPATLGRLFEIIYALGGENSANRHWPDIYPSGLVDYQAHLQVMGIWMEAEAKELIAAGGKSDDAKPAGPPVVDDSGDNGDKGMPLVLDVTDSQLDILRAQAARDPRDPLFQAVLGKYTGDMGPAIDACLARDQYAGEYVRCNDYRRCQLAAWIFACDIVVRSFK